jgi:hypothetical protein
MLKKINTNSEINNNLKDIKYSVLKYNDSKNILGILILKDMMYFMKI